MSEPDKLMEISEESLKDLEAVKNVSERMYWNSLYYSIFYAAKSALIRKGFEPKTHSGVDTLVSKIFYKEEGFISVDEAKFFSQMKTAREEIDYNPESSINYNKEKMKQRAENFIQEMKNIKN